MFLHRELYQGRGILEISTLGVSYDLFRSKDSLSKGIRRHGSYPMATKSRVP